MKLYAEPYDISFTGFYFESAREFETKRESMACEEFMIDFIDSDVIDGKLFEKLGCNQGNLDGIFELVDRIEYLDQKELVAFEFLLDFTIVNNINKLEELLDKVGDVNVIDETLENYAYELVHDYLSHCTDYRKFGRDLVLDRQVVEFNGYLITNAGDF